MNFLKTFYKVTAIFLFTAIFLLIKFDSCSIYATETGSPYIQIFFFKDYSFSSKSYSIAQNHLGIIFVGNFNGILEYNGSSWKQHNFPGRPVLAATEDNIVYAGGLNQFGYLSYNKLNQTEFVSLIDSVPESLLPFGQISFLKTIGDKVFFATEKQLILWDGKLFQVLETFKKSPTKFFVVDSVLISTSSDRGIILYHKGKKTDFPSGNFFKDKSVEDILPYEGKYLVKTVDAPGFYIVSKNNVQSFPSPLYNLFERYGYSTGKLLSDNNYVFGTQRGGLLLMDSSGNLINHIRRDQGLLEDNVSVLYTDHSDNLWVLHNNGLSRVEIPSNVSYFDRVAGLRGSVSSIIRHMGTLYFATSQGVFYLSNEENNFFSKIRQVDGIRNSCFNFIKQGDILYVTSEAGIFQIANFSGKFLYKGDMEAAIASETNPGIFFLGFKNGIASIEYKNGKLTNPVTIPSIGNKILSIAEENDEILWAGTDYNGIYRIRKNKNFNESEVQHFQVGKGLPPNLIWINIHKTHLGILFSTSHGVYRYNENIREFYSDTLLGLNFLKGEFWLFPLAEDKNKNLWYNKNSNFNQDSETAVSFYSPSKGNYRFKPLPLQRKKDFHIKSIYPDINGTVWFGGYNGVLKFDTLVTQKKCIHLHAIISKVTWNTDSVIFYGSNDPIYKTDFSRFVLPINSLRFDFTTTNYESEGKALYQFKLEGFDKDWSAWSNVSFKEYTNLPGKEYSFNLRVRNLQDEISEITSFSFRFVPPFYLTWWAFIFYVLILFSFANMIIRHRLLRFAREKFKLEGIINERTEELLKQKEKSEELLSNLLPKDTADELKLTGKASTHKYNLVTVLFSDIEGFTKIAEQMNPEVLVDELDKFFFKFDSVVDKYNIEKIKTIGDAYMCAGGIPDKNRTNPVEVILAALEITHYMKQLQQTNSSVWDLRIGIHTGPVIAGVVGQKKLSYDIWGDTVNTASRMESSGEPGKINISGSTYEMVHDFFACEYRGKMPVKYKGNIDMHFVNGIRPELSVDSKGLLPNDLFFIKVQLLRLQDMEEMFFKRLENELPVNLHFHNLKKTLAACSTAELIGRAENLNEEEMLIIRSAAVFLNSGYIKDYSRNEDYRCEFARDVLPRFKYSEEHLLKICHLLSVSFEKLSPANKLEKILYDTYYDFLGRVDLPELARELFNEQKEYGLAENEKDWIEKFIAFIQKHEFFTETANKMRAFPKEEQISRVKSIFG